MMFTWVLLYSDEGVTLVTLNYLFAFCLLSHFALLLQLLTACRLQTVMRIM